MKLGDAPKIHGVQPDLTVRAPTHGNEDVAIDGHRHDESVRVVGVLANQVDAPGGARHQVRGAAEYVCERLP